eukprot:2503484-Rhodomonas_salina.1
MPRRRQPARSTWLAEAPGVLNIAQLASQSTTEINSDSIEAGLMTLILKGNSSYFQTNTGCSDVSLELEDVITIHIMQDDGQGELADKVAI